MDYENQTIRKRSRLAGVRWLPLLLLGAVFSLTGRAETKSEDGGLRYYGYYTLKTTQYVSVAIDGQARQWSPLPRTSQGYRLIKLEDAGSTLIVRGPDGRERAIKVTRDAPGQIEEVADSKEHPPPMTRFMPLDTPAPDMSDTTGLTIYEIYPPKGVKPSLKGLDWDWIESDKNPMRDMPIIIRRDFPKKWHAMTPKEKAGYVELFRQSGWWVRIQDDSGGTSQNFTKLRRP